MAYTTGPGATERYTPTRIIESARTLMGSISFDPASDETANALVRASSYITKEQNGLLSRWAGNVWCNPPYGKAAGSKLSDWVTKMVTEHQTSDSMMLQGCLIVPAFTAQKWFLPLWDYPICFLRERVKFIDGATGEVLGSPMYGHCVVYMPPRATDGEWNAEDAYKFKEAFKHLGTVIVGL